MKTTFYASMLASVLGITVFSSCSNEDCYDDFSQTENRNIEFQADVNAMITRSVTTLGNLKDFTVSAYLKQESMRSLFMNNVKVSNQNGKWTTDDTYVWPYSGTLSFYSYSPSNLSVNMPAADKIDSTIPSFNYTAPSNSYQQNDVLYAVNADHQFTGSNASSIVNVNFRHALSQIVFSAKCENANWQVDIADVQIHNVKSAGQYTFPVYTTSKLTGDADKDVRGTWTVGTEINSYNTGFEPVIGVGATAVSLTTSENFPLLLIPQTTTAWDPANDPKCTKNGAYFMVRCKLKQKTAEGTYALIWPKAGVDAYGYIAVPVNINWQEGKKYTYVFNFKDGAGFIPPTETGGGEGVVPGNSVLAKINFSVLVDDFVSSSTNQVNM